ncbi:uncharacterized protein GGS22DRAFT_196030 [Annulohypoxylon maeteangense]|uniref:uncharacterized protein n=1 Tax=Annulohypoxylon maeteangense TaxID=1927788 RepID=UPI002007BC63|nr:uncharacterized protein GGS22DRAFT_196030 [Annulohypoxylon maeteangense]KAI0882329.1 hypothetical protein GGS22DRAFT_196030 [Annulohypoxylon maeteangense]
MTKTMKSIPLEVLRMILKILSAPDLKQLRLVSSRLNQEASAVLFQRVYASSHREDLDVLSAIANHPTLSRHPRELVYVGVFYARDKRVECLSYLEGLERQDEMMTSGLDVDIITSALIKLPHIRKLTFTNHWCWKSNPPMAKNFFPDYEERPGGNTLTIPQNETLFDHGFKVMCRALSISGREVEELTMHYFSEKGSGHGDRDEPWNSGFYFSSLPHGAVEIERACNAFRSMRKIELSLSYTWDPDLPDFWEDACAGLAKALGAATELCELTLNFNQDELEDELSPRSEANELPLTAALTAQPLPKLRTLRLRYKYMQWEELVAVLKPLCGTVETLELASIYLINGSWRETAMELHKLEWKKLESTNFVDLRDGYDISGPPPEDIQDDLSRLYYDRWDGVEDCMRRGDPNLISVNSNSWIPAGPADDYCESYVDYNEEIGRWRLRA